MEFAYKIYPQEMLITVRVAGSYTVDELWGELEQMGRDELYNRNFQGVFDITESAAEWDVDNVQEYVVKQYEAPRFSLGRWAVLAESGRQTAVAMIAHDMEKTLHETKVFCTEKAASDWLGAEVSEHLSELRHLH